MSYTKLTGVIMLRIKSYTKLRHLEKPGPGSLSKKRDPRSKDKIIKICFYSQFEYADFESEVRF